MSRNNSVDHTEARGALALPVEEPVQEPRANSPFWTRPTTYRRSASLTSAQRPRTFTGRMRRNAGKYHRQAMRHYSALSLLQKALLSTAGVITIVLGILFLVFNERIFGWLAPYAKKWRDVRFGWLILWAATFVVSFPPLIGYSSCVTVAGFVYGFPTGWFIVASATIVGSTASFLLSRHVLQGFVSRLIKNDSRFAALALVIKHDGLKLLVMIRLCPLPYSLSNGALSTIPTVNWLQFMLATALVSPKLLLHVFVGAKIGELAEKGKEMDSKTKAISYISIAIGLIAGVITGWVIYRQTKLRAKELEEQERQHVRSGSRDEIRSDYSDDPGALEAAEALREDDDDISLRETWEEDYEDEEGEGPYRDNLTDDEDAQEVGDVFDDGDGDVVDERK